MQQAPFPSPDIRIHRTSSALSPADYQVANMTDALANAAQEWFKKGTDAMGLENWDFAVECFSNSIKMKPDVQLFRQTKLGCCRRMYGDNKTGARMASMKLMPIRGKIKKAKMKKDWKTIDALAEQGLTINPWDAQLFMDLGEAASEQEHSDVARFGYFEAVKIDPKNVANNMALGYLLFDRNEFEEARKSFQRVRDVDAMHSEARTMLSRCDTQSVIHRSYEGKESTKEVAKEEPAATNAYEEDRKARRGARTENAAPGESEEMDMRAAIRKDPKNVARYQKLISLLEGERRFPEAIEQIDLALELAPGDQGLLESKEDYELEIMKERLTEASERARKNPNRERVVEKAKALAAEFLEREISMLTNRIENHPQDMKLKMELAERHRKQKNFKLAIPLLQQATKDTRLQNAALVKLGECFVRTGQMSLGKRQFDKALEALTSQDNPDEFKLAHYFLGRLNEKAENNDQAEYHYGEILGVDWEYKDVQKRHSDLQGGEDEFGDFDDL